MAGVMLCLIVMTVAIGLVDLARSAPERVTVERHDSGTVADEPPDELPGGHPLPPVPRAVAQAADGPVVVAATLEALPAGVDCPHEDVPWTAGPVATPILLTPDGLQMQLIGEGHPTHPDLPEELSASNATMEANDPMRLTMTCHAKWQRGSWRDTQRSLAAHGLGDKPPQAHSSEASCCAHDGLGSAHAEITVADNVAWLLQDRGGYWLAHPTERLSAVRVDWQFRELQRGGGPEFDEPDFDGGTFVRLLDADGEVLDEHSVG